MLEIDYDAPPDNIYSLVSIKEVRDKIGPVSAVDIWFPHISKKIVCSWGHLDFREYTTELLFTERGNREGLPMEVLKELSIIIDVHNERFPQYKLIETQYL